MIDLKDCQYRTPRTMNEAWGPYSRLSIAGDKSIVREIAEALGYVVAGLATGGVIVGVLYLILGRW